MEFVKPKLIVMSAPSGSGKTSIFTGARQYLPNLMFSISYTTRQPRVGEKNGIDYFFVDTDQFCKMRDEGQFLEWAEVYGNFYGTSRSFISESQKAGKIVVLDIDVQGAMQLQKLDDLDAVYVFIMPPSLEALSERLSGRGTEDAISLKRRMDSARQEISFRERYNHQIINDQLDIAIEDFVKVVLKECYALDSKDGSDLNDIVKRLQQTENQDSC